jgi:Tol biopolymer transport system component
MNASLAFFSGVIVCALPGFAAAQATTERVSVDSSGGQGNGNSGLSDPGHYVDMGATICADGTVVAFASDATNLVAGDTNQKSDVFVHDRTTGATERVSVSSSGAEGDRNSVFPSLSADGIVVAFASDATTLVAGDTNQTTDVFVRDRATGTTERISVDSAGNEANGPSTTASCSADGQLVAFVSKASNLVAGDTNGGYDAFVHDRATGVTERISVSTAGAQGNGNTFSVSLSADGRFVVFSSLATNLVAGDTNGVEDVFVRDRSAGTTERVSVDSSGMQGDGDSFSSYSPSISADGSVVVFTSFAANLVAGDTNGVYDVFVHDRSTGITERESVSSSGEQAHDYSSSPSLSADGQVVAFESFADNLVANQRRFQMDVFVHDRSDGTTELVSVDPSGADCNSYSFYPSIAADGQLVLFDSMATNLVPGDSNGFCDVFVRTRCEAVASWSNYGDGFAGTNGIPSFVARANPVRGTTLALDVGNSSGRFAFGLLVLGYARADLHSGWGGDLLVQPAIDVAIGLAPTGATLSGDLFDDDALCGVVVDLQVLEVDPGAARGVSFTPGLELVIGR